MNAILTWAAAHRRQLALAGCACGLVAVGAAGGAWLHPRTVTVYSRESEQTLNESMGLDLRRIQTKKEEPSTLTRERIVYRSGPVQERTVTRVDKGGTSVTTDTNEHVHDDLHLQAKQDERITTTVSPEGRWSFGVLAGADSAGSVVAGAGVDYRFLGPATAGVQVLAPVAGAPGRFTLLFKLGLRL